MWTGRQDPPGRHLQAQRRGKQDLSAAGLTCERGERERGREGQTDRDSHRQEQANRQRDRDRDWLTARVPEDQTPDRQAHPQPDRQDARAGDLRPDSQVRDARLAHGCGDGFDRGAERVEQLGHLAGAASLPALLHDEAGQGNDICIEGRAVRHAGAGCCALGGRCGQGECRTRRVRGERTDRGRRVSAPLGALTVLRQVPASVSYRGQVTVPAPGTPPLPAPPLPSDSARAPFSVTSSYLSHLPSSTIFAVSTLGPCRHLHFLHCPPTSLGSSRGLQLALWSIPLGHLHYHLQSLQRPGRKMWS